MDRKPQKRIYDIEFNPVLAKGRKELGGEVCSGVTERTLKIFTVRYNKNDYILLAYGDPGLGDRYILPDDYSKELISVMEDAISDTITLDSEEKVHYWIGEKDNTIYTFTLDTKRSELVFKRRGFSKTYLFSVPVLALFKLSNVLRIYNEMPEVKYILRKPDRKQKNQQVNSIDLSKNITMTVGVEDKIVICKEKECYDDHTIQNVIVRIPVCLRDDSKDYCEVPASYCPVCRNFYVMDYRMQKAQRMGIILARVMSYKQYITQYRYQYGSHSLNEQSVLYQYGYNVTGNSWASLVQRRKVLEYIIKHGIMPKSKVQYYLSLFVKLHTSDNKAEARKKWLADMEFVSNLKKFD